MQMIRKAAFILLLILAAGYLSEGTAVSEKKGDSGGPITIREKAGLGMYLADSKGMTLYYFRNDSEGKSACTGECLKAWPVFYTDILIVPDELKLSDLGIITREDGKEQIIYKGLPLYYYHKDKKPGDTLGHKINDVWFVVNP